MPTDRKTIRSYNAYAATWAKKLRSGNNAPHTYLEKPAMYSKLPHLKGKSVLCIGCGTGEECDYLKSRGAKKVIGIDISKGLIDFAKQSYPHLEFHVMDMEQLSFAANSFDFVYSSLTMHYIKNWTKTLRNIHKVLKRNGIFLFSTHHPVRWGSQIKRSRKKESFIMGYEKYPSGKRKVFGDYLNARKINDIWFNELKVSYYHRPLSDILGEILKGGFVISDFSEPKPIKAAAKLKPDFYRALSRIPLFMIFKLTKK